MSITGMRSRMWATRRGNDGYDMKGIWLVMIWWQHDCDAKVNEGK